MRQPAEFLNSINSKINATEAQLILKGASSDRNITKILTIIFLFIGVIYRLYFPLRADFPLHDGGLFYIMIRDLQTNNFALPFFTSYNEAHIPYVYPPFGLYFAGILAAYTSFPLLDILRLLPAIISSFSLLAFYLLCREYLTSPWEILISVFVFTFMPIGMQWLVMGGGLTRAFGMLFSLLALWQAYQLFANSEAWRIFPTGLLCALTVLSHPEVAWFLTYSMAIFWMCIRPNRRTLLYSIGVVSICLLLIAPWLITVFIRHGTAFLSPMYDNGFSRLAALIFIFRNISGERFIGLLNALGMLGIISNLTKKQWFLPIWFLGIYLLQGRAPDQRVVVPFSMLVAIGSVQLVWPLFFKIKNNTIRKYLSISTIVLATSFVPISSYLSQTPYLKFLSSNERAAIYWIKDNTPPSSHVIVITGLPWWEEISPEWLSVLSGRVSLGVVQGYEWLPNFSHRVQDGDKLQACVRQSAICLDNWAKDTGHTFDYVYIPDTCQATSDLAMDGCSNLRQALMTDSSYKLVYLEKGAVIFARDSYIR